MDDPGSEQRYTCLTGHEIPGVELAEASEVLLLDGRVTVQVCREHGCPIAVNRAAPDRTARNVP